MHGPATSLSGPLRKRRRAAGPHALFALNLSIFRPSLHASSPAGIAPRRNIKRRGTAGSTGEYRGASEPQKNQGNNRKLGNNWEHKEIWEGRRNRRRMPGDSGEQAKEVFTE